MAQGFALKVLGSSSGSPVFSHSPEIRRRLRDTQEKEQVGCRTCSFKWAYHLFSQLDLWEQQRGAMGGTTPHHLQVNQKAHTLINLMPHSLFILHSHQPAAALHPSHNAVCAGDASLTRMGSDTHRTRCVPQPAPVAGGLSIPAPSAALAQWQRP